KRRGKSPGCRHDSRFGPPPRNMAANVPTHRIGASACGRARMAFGVHGLSRTAALALKEDCMLRCWRTRRVTLGNERGLSLVELMLATTMIAILSAIAVPLYAKKLSLISVAHEKVMVQQSPPPSGKP